MIKKIISFIKDKRQYFIVSVILILIIVGLIINNIPKSKVVEGNDDIIENENKSFIVTISGEVVSPNRYLFDEEVYLFEVVKKANGLTKYGSIEGINLIEKINSDYNIVIGKSNDASKNIEIIDHSKTSSFCYFYIENTFIIYKFDKDISYEEIFWILGLDNSVYNLDLKGYLNDDLYLKKKKALLNINKATYEDLINLGFLSTNVINNILNFIDLYGSIDSADELNSINGIGDKTLEKLLKLICFK